MKSKWCLIILILRTYGVSFVNYTATSMMNKFPKINICKILYKENVTFEWSHIQSSFEKLKIIHNKNLISSKGKFFVPFTYLKSCSHVEPIELNYSNFTWKLAWTPPKNFHLEGTGEYWTLMYLHRRNFFLIQENFIV